MASSTTLEQPDCDELQDGNNELIMIGPIALRPCWGYKCYTKACLLSVLPPNVNFSILLTLRCFLLLF